MTNEFEDLFELFYKNITLEMNPPGFPKYYCDVMKYWWKERFINAYYNIQEPRGLKSWGEAPRMWLAGYQQNL